MVIDWQNILKDAYLKAIECSSVNDRELRALLEPHLTSNLDNESVIFKGLEQSYYYKS